MNKPKKPQHEQDRPDISGEKSTLNLIVAFAVFAVLIFLFDAFVLHSIPVSGGKFDLSTSDSEYADATILFSDTSGSNSQTYLVEKDGELHILYYEFHYISGRGDLVGDVIADPVGTNVYYIGTFLGRYEVTIADGRMGRRNYLGINTTRTAIYSPEIIFSGILAIPLALIENALYKKLLRKKS